jgi:hypothetical protein
MKFTIVADDHCVGVEGEYFSPLDLSQLNPTIHAVQWYGEYGEVEYKNRFENGAIVKPANVLITDVTPYQFAVDVWNAAKAAAAQAQVEAEAAAQVAAQTPAAEPAPQ